MTELKNEYFINLSTKRKISYRNALLMEELAKKDIFNSGALLSRAQRLKDCLNYWEWAKYEKNKVLDLKSVSRCKDFYCPNCRKFQLGKIILKLTPAIENLLKVESANPYLLTLTVPNCKHEDLDFTVGKLIKKFKVLWDWLYRDKSNYKDRVFDCVGGFRVLEITYNYKTGMWHPHIHAVIFLKKDSAIDFIKKYKDLYQEKMQRYSYKSDADYMIGKLWTLAYNGHSLNDLKELKEEDILVCDIREMVMPSGLYEVFKYVFKDNDVINVDSFGTMYYALKGKRLKQSYGALYGFVSDKDDEDQLYDNEEEFLNKWITVQEDFEIYRNNNILDIITKFEDYKKISRFNKDKEYMNIRD